MVANKKMKKEALTEVMIAKSYCFKHDVLIYVVPLSNTTCKIEINYKGKKLLGKKIYQSSGGKSSDDKWWLEIDKLYIFYYNELLKQ